MLAHPHVLANYNAWANRRLHGICAELSADKISQDRGAFFGSIPRHSKSCSPSRYSLPGTDRRHRSTFSGLNDTLHSDLSALSAHQSEEDDRWIALTEEIDPTTLDEPFVFWTLGLDNRDRREVPKHIYFTNLAQHQAHHRGQTHNMVSQAGLKPPSLGYIDFRMEMDRSLITTPDAG